MNNKYYSNNTYLLKQKAKKYISYNRYLLLFLAFIFLVAIITGIFTGIKGADNISISNINDKTLLKFFKRDVGPVSFFITRLIQHLFYIAFIFICGKTKFCSLISCIFIAFMSYSLGLNSAVFMILFGLGGTVNAIIVIIPIKTCVLFIYILMISISIKNSCIIKKYGSCYFDNSSIIKWLWFLLVLIIITIIETILINMFSSAFIFDF